MCRHFEVRCSSVFQKEPGNQCNQNIVEDGEEGETRVTYQGTDHAEPRRTRKGLWLLIQRKWEAMRGV